MSDVLIPLGDVRFTEGRGDVGDWFDEEDVDVREEEEEDGIEAEEEDEDEDEDEVGDVEEEEDEGGGDSEEDGAKNKRCRSCSRRFHRSGPLTTEKRSGS